MKVLLVLISIVLLTGCGSLIKGAAVSDAAELVSKGRYSDALEKTTIAESLGDLTSIEKARIYYLRAQALDGLGRTEEANGYYQYVAVELDTSPYSDRASSRYKQRNDQPTF